MAERRYQDRETGQLIADWLELWGIKSANVAKACGIAPSTLSQWLHGKRRPQNIRQVYCLLEYIRASPQIRKDVFIGWGFPVNEDDSAGSDLSLAEIAEELADIENSLSVLTNRVRALQSAISKKLISS